VGTRAIGSAAFLNPLSYITTESFQQLACKNTNMPGSSLSIPNFLYGTAWKKDPTAALTELAVRTGFRGIDTANQLRHYHEAGVGEGLAAAYKAGVVTRGDIFLQTKFTYRQGQDHRLPYDPEASLTMQVAQSMASSLEHLHTDYIDSLLLHGPAWRHAWSNEDCEVWNAMQKERDAGRTRLLGVSNVGLHHLEQMVRVHSEAPSFVQNRCFAVTGWDRDVRVFCRERSITYQGFSLLTANMDVLQHPVVTDPAAELGTAPEQIVFAFARQIGILPLTGTTNVEHMKLDLASRQLILPEKVVHRIDRIAG
jgi:diketogulonate reductase-like aldo/keto reductase